MGTPYIGEIRMIGGNYAPAGWAFCEGQTLAIANYETLFNLIGTTYGGDGFTTFQLPDLRGRIPMHMGQGAGLTSRVLSEMGGSESVPVTIAQLPAHGHSVLAAAEPATTKNPAGAALAQPDNPGYATAGGAGTTFGPASVGSTGGFQTHDNLQPALCVNFIIAFEGIYPSRP